MENKEVINKIYVNGSFLIHLYDKLDNNGNSYFCPQIKIEQLLIIANIEYYQKYKEKMNELDLIYERTLGYHFDTSNLFFRSPITISRKINDKPLSKEELLKILEERGKESRINAIRIMWKQVLNMLSKMIEFSKFLSGDELKKALAVLPEYEESIRQKNRSVRLMALSDIEKIYICGII